MHFFFFRSTPAKSLQSKTEDPFFSTEGENRFGKREAINVSQVRNQPFFTPAHGNPHGSSVQAKLKIGGVNDPQEREADRMAEHVVTQSDNTSAIQTKCAECRHSEKNGEEEKESLVQEKAGGVQTKPIFESNPGEEVQTQSDSAAAKSHTSETGLSQQLQSSKGRGDSLQEDTRADMEGAFGADFSGVRIHTGSEAEEMNQGLQAKAFTHGQDIYFNQGQYAPSAKDGTKLLAHELTHVVQQNGNENEESIRRYDIGTATGEEYAPDLDQGSGDDSGINILNYMYKDTGYYLLHHSTNTNQLANDIKDYFKKTPIATGSNFASWMNDRGEVFLLKLISDLLPKLKFNLFQKLLEFLAPISKRELEIIIEKARGLYQYYMTSHGMGTEMNLPDEVVEKLPNYEPAVADRIAFLIFQQIRSALARVMPQFISALNQAYLREEVGQSLQMKKEGVLAGHPMDEEIIEVLWKTKVQEVHSRICSFDTIGLEIDLESYRKANPSEAFLHNEQKIREGSVLFSFEKRIGYWQWIRVSSPLDANHYEIAKELFGNERYAYLISAAPPLFAFRITRSIELQSPHQENWQAQEGQILPGAHEKFEYPDPEDLPAELREEIALNQAKKYQATGANRQEVIHRMRLTLNIIKELKEDSKITWGLGRYLEPICKNLDERSKALHQSNDPAEVWKWDAQSAAQYKLVGEAAALIHNFAGSYNQMLERANDSTGVKSFSGAQRWILRSVLQEYIHVITISDLVDSARSKLEREKEKAEIVAFELKEEVLIQIKENLLSVETTKGYNNETAGEKQRAYSLDELKGTRRRIEQTIGEAKALAETDPETAKQMMDKLQTEMRDLQINNMLVTYMDQVDQLMQALYDAESKLGAIRSLWGGGNDILENLIDEGRTFRANFRSIRTKYQQSQGDQTKQKKALEELSIFTESKEWEDYFKRISDAIEDHQYYDKWTGLGVAVIIAIASMGAGALASGAVGTGAVATGVGIGTEIITASALSTLILQENPSLGSFAQDLALNAVSFGVGRLAGAGMKSALPAKYIGTGVGKSAEFAAEFMSSNIVVLAHAKAVNPNLSMSQAFDMLLENAATSAVTAVSTRVAKPLFDGLHMRGAQIRNLASRRRNLRKQAAELKDSTDFDLVKKLVEEDRLLLKEENEFLEKVKELEKHDDPEIFAKKAEEMGLTSESARKLIGIYEQNQRLIDDRELANVTLALQPTSSPRDFTVRTTAELEQVVSHHQKLGNKVSSTRTDEVTKAATVTITRLDGSSFRVTVGAGIDSIGVVGKPTEAVTETPQPRYLSLDDILVRDSDGNVTGFADHVPVLRDRYLDYRQRKGEQALLPEEWAIYQTNAEKNIAAQHLEILLGPHYRRTIRRNLGTDNLLLESIEQPGEYQVEIVDQDIAFLSRNAKLTNDSIFNTHQERLFRLIDEKNLSTGEISAGSFRILKGIVGEMLSLRKQRDILRRIQNDHPEAELVSGVMIKLMKDGTLGNQKQFTDNLIILREGDNITVLGKIEVKSGSRGGAEATTQFFEWVEGRLTDGSELHIPDVGVFTWHPNGFAGSQVTGLANAQPHSITPKHTEEGGLSSGDQSVKDPKRHTLPRSAPEIDFLTRRIIEIRAQLKKNSDQN